jgi:hypothetical protein
MKRGNSITKILLICVLVLAPSFSIASWKDSACRLEKASAEDLSNKYTEPFCITNVNGKTNNVQDVNYASEFINPALTNQLSSDREK